MDEKMLLALMAGNKGGGGVTIGSDSGVDGYMDIGEIRICWVHSKKSVTGTAGGYNQWSVTLPAKMAYGQYTPIVTLSSLNGLTQYGFTASNNGSTTCELTFKHAETMNPANVEYSLICIGRKGD